MKRVGILILFMGCFLLSSKAFSQKIQTLEYEKIASRWAGNPNNDTTYVVNFWATWCAPCVKELPAFQRLHENHKDKKIKVLLLSLDLKNQIDTKLIPFLANKKVTAEVIHLAKHQGPWISEVDKDWEGDIPVTLVINPKKQKRKFHKGILEYTELLELAEIK